MIYRLLLFFVLACCTQSCKVLYPNELFKSDDDYYYFQFASREVTEHVISPADHISFRLYSKSGFEIIDVVDIVRSGSASGSVVYEVRLDGFVEFPIIGLMHVAGKTRLELEELLEQRFSRLYNDPYIILTVTNRRAFVFFGIGQASIISLPSEQTNLIEVIALAGGINEGNKSHNVKILRGDFKNPEIILVDLSKLSNLPEAELTVMANDIIIIEPVKTYATKILGQITPIFSLITSLLTIYLFFRNINNI